MRRLAFVLALAVASLLLFPRCASAPGTPPVTADVDERGNTPLHRAALAGDEGEVQRLIAAGASVAAVNAAGATPLHYATGNLGSVRALLAAGADPNSKSKAGNTPLCTAAARAQSFAVVQELLQHGADAKIKKQYPGADMSTSPLAVAAATGDLESVRLLSEHGAAVQGPGQFPPINAATYAGHTAIVQFLLAHGASPNDSDGGTGHALNASLYTWHPEIARFLVEHGVDLQQRSGMATAVPPMVWAAYSESGDDAVARLLLEHGAGLDATASTGETALRWAMKRGETRLTRYLKSSGAPDGGPVAKTKAPPARAVPRDAAGRTQLLRDAVQRALPLLQRGSDGFLANGFVQQQGCVSCHHQTLPLVAYARAQRRGFQVDETSLGRQLTVQLKSWNAGVDGAYELDEPQPDAPTNLGYGLVGLAALAYPPDALTAAMGHYLVETQCADGSWPAYDRRPPIEEGQIIGTAYAVAALQKYPPPRHGDLARQFARARGWLLRAVPEDLNQRAHRLLGLTWAGASRDEVAPLVRELIAVQRPDGGFQPLPTLGSDAYATALVLFALRESGGVQTGDAVFRAGADYLLRTQFDDGSWWVQSRTWPLQPHFDSGFPHGKDQWISAGATALAAIVLLDELPVSVRADECATVPRLVAQYAAAVKAAPANVAAASADAGPEFAADVLPILQRSCIECHSGDKPKGGLHLDSRDGMLKGGRSGEPAVVAGDVEASQLLRFVTDKVEDLEMPPLAKRAKFAALTAAEVAVLTAWIKAGAR
jgi:ankyrin repeat protein